VSATGTCAGAVIVAGLSEPPGRIVNVAGRRTFEGGTPPVAGAPGFVVVSGPVGGVPEAVGTVPVGVPVVLGVGVPVVLGVVVPVVVPVAAGPVDDAVEVAEAVGDLLPADDDPHPTGVMSKTRHKRTGIPLTFAA
jgi:hypothetical protein